MNKKFNLDIVSEFFDLLKKIIFWELIFWYLILLRKKGRAHIAARNFD